MSLTRFTSCLVLALLLTFPTRGIASSDRKPLVAAVMSSNIAPYNHALNGFRKKLDSAAVKPDIRIYNLESAQGGAENILFQKVMDSNPDLVLAVGTEASRSCRLGTRPSTWSRAATRSTTTRINRM